jgi:hypothetical protein
MIMRKVIPFLIVCSFLSQSAPAQKVSPISLPLALPSTVVHAQELNKTVVPITELKFLGFGIEGKFGTGFCLDPVCRFIGTNYHVAMTARPRKIKGQRVIHRYFATGPNDEGATLNDVPSMGPMKYTVSRDLAILELRHPLPYHHGLAFSLDDLQVGQEVDIYAYPKESINPIRSLLKFHGTFKGQTITGLLAFGYSLSADKAIRPGASGGIVVDSKTQQIVGVLNEIASNGGAIAMAVPVQSLADFVSKVQPCLAQSLFPFTKGISPVSADLYPKFVPQAPVGILQHRPEEPADVKALRSKAQLLADSMRNFIAVQTFAWGSGNKEPAAEAAYEVRVLDGYQRFRKYPDGKKESEEIPHPPLNRWVLPADEWSKLPEMVGTEFRLKVHEAPDVVVNKQGMKVFQYYSSVEDNLCPFAPVEDFGFFTISKPVPVACYGEVWTDEDANIIRMSEHLELSDKLKAYRGWEDFQVVLTYGWLQRTDQAPRLIPLTIYTRAEMNKKVYWCRGRFVGYQVFTTRARLLAN